MASPAVAAAQVNSVASLSRPDSPASINSSSTNKRKRELSDDPEPGVRGDEQPRPAANGLHTSQDCKSLIRDFFNVLESHDADNFPVLRRRLPDSVPDGEPSTKRAKSEETSRPTTITDKVTQGAYETLDDLVSDIVQAANAQVKQLESADVPSNESAIAKTVAFRSKALELYRRELAYPNVPRPIPGKSSPGEEMLSLSTGNLVLSTVGAAPTLRPLFTSLQRAATPDKVPKSIPEGALPNGVTVAKVLPEGPVSGDRSGRSLTLGELFPSPRNLPPLQPPKAPKNTTKSNVLTFYHPELTEKSKYRSGSYFSQTISAGHWLDYSNATPTVPGKTKQRERAQSLAGHKPSSVELEVSEMEALFRGAFSSFAPCKDDSAAIVPSGQVSRIWWQRVGRRNYAKLVDSDAPEEENEDDVAANTGSSMEIDEERVKDAIENWDESAIDPTLDHVLGKKSDDDKEVDDLLEDISDMIETLASYQRNRNLTLPTSQDRYSADPVNGDMLRNGSLSHQPSEEEMMTYQALKAQLAAIIQTLPPYAVARLNSDKLGELNVSTKIEVRSDEYRGVMEEDEPARLARQAAQAAAMSDRRQTHRAPSVSAGAYANHQYQAQFTPSARPIGNAQHFPQTPVRPPAQNMYPRGPSSVPIPQAHHQAQGRVPPATQYRPQMYAPQLAKAQGPYGHSNMAQQYVASPTTQQRIPQHPNYNLGQSGTPNARYPQAYPAAAYQQQQQILPQHPQHAQSSPHHPPLAQQQQPPYSPYANGAQLARTMSPQVAQAHPYSPSPTPPQQHQQMAPRPPYGGSPAPPGMPPPPPNAAPVSHHQHQYGAPGSSSPGNNMMPAGNRPPPHSNLTGYATVMPEVQQRQLMEQARARADAEQRASGHIGKVSQGESGGGGGGGGVVGLAGIGLGGHVDLSKVAAAKMQQQQQQTQMGGVVGGHHGGAAPVNGQSAAVQGTASPAPAPGSAPAGAGAVNK
ncbi:hypothetical protein VTK56DRAFT_1422 [Thermocarpiscus australiensis]